MNKIITFFIITLSISCSVKRLSDLESMNVYGKITGIQEKIYNPNDSLVQTRVFEFNNKGNLTSLMQSFENSDYKIRTENKYNLKGKLVRQDYYRSDNLMLTQKYLKVNNFLDSIFTYDTPNKNLVGVGTISYDKKGNKLETKTFDKQLNLMYSDHTKYNASGKAIKRVVIDKNTISGKFTMNYVYDTLDRIQFCKTIKSDSIITFEEAQYLTDKNNNWTEKLVLDKNGSLQQKLVRNINYK